MNARERAVDAAQEFVDRRGKWIGYKEAAMAADAASDVWEPLLRKAMHALRLAWPHIPEGEAAVARDEAFLAITEALADDDDPYEDAAAAARTEWLEDR